MIKEIRKFISILLIITLLLPTSVNAAVSPSELQDDEDNVLDDWYYVTCCFDYLDYLDPPTKVDIKPDKDYSLEYNYDFEHGGFIRDLPLMQASELAVMFNIQYSPTVAHVGYIFRLVEHAVVPFAENKNVSVINAPLNIFTANTLEDIIEFVDPAFIMYIEPDFVIFQDPMPTSIHSLSPFEPHVFEPFTYAPSNDPRFRIQWNLDLIRFNR